MKFLVPLFAALVSRTEKVELVKEGQGLYWSLRSFVVRQVIAAAQCPRNLFPVFAGDTLAGQTCSEACAEAGSTKICPADSFCHCRKPDDDSFQCCPTAPAVPVGMPCGSGSPIDPSWPCFSGSQCQQQHPTSFMLKGAPPPHQKGKGFAPPMKGNPGPMDFKTHISVKQCACPKGQMMWNGGCHGGNMGMLSSFLIGPGQPCIPFARQMFGGLMGGFGGFGHKGKGGGGNFMMPLLMFSMLGGGHKGKGKGGGLFGGFDMTMLIRQCIPGSFCSPFGICLCRPFHIQMGQFCMPPAMFAGWGGGMKGFGGLGMYGGFGGKGYGGFGNYGGFGGFGGKGFGGGFGNFGGKGFGGMGMGGMGMKGMGGWGGGWGGGFGGKGMMGGGWGGQGFGKGFNPGPMPQGPPPGWQQPMNPQSQWKGQAPPPRWKGQGFPQGHAGKYPRQAYPNYNYPQYPANAQPKGPPTQPPQPQRQPEDKSQRQG